MKLKRIFTLFLILTVIRELGYINLSYYRSNLDSSVKSHWSSNSRTFYDDTPHLVVSAPVFKSYEIPVRVMYKGKILYEEPSSGLTAVVTITDLNDGFLWLPFYKSSAISAGAEVRLDGAFDGSYWEGSRVDMLEVSGNSRYSGNISIRGICSRHTAVTLVRNDIVKCFTEAARKYFTEHRIFPLSPSEINMVQ